MPDLPSDPKIPSLIIKGSERGFDAGSPVITLSRYRARLGRAPKGNRYEQVMGSENPEQEIAALSGEEIYGILRENEFREAAELLQCASLEQVQSVADFSLWSGDRPAPARFAEWIEMMAELPYEKVGAWLRGLDVELVTLLIRKAARIYDLSLEEAPEESDGLFYPTPDRMFVLDILGYSLATPDDPDGDPHGSENSANALIRVLDNLYRDDLNFARRILVGAKAELDSELEETAYRWRQGRLADQGFVDSVEALEIYRELDPAAVKVGESDPDAPSRSQSESDPVLLHAPTALATQMKEASSRFVAALGQITKNSEVDEIHFGLVSLANRVLSADRIDPADERAGSVALERMLMTLDIAVEFLGRDSAGALDDDRAVLAVRTVPVVRLFRLGVSLIGKVRRLARTWQQKGPFAALGDLDLIEEPDATIFDGLLRVRPAYSRLLDNPASAGDRSFSSLADIARASAAIQRIAAAQAMLIGLGVRAEHLLPEALNGSTPTERVDIDAGVLARTALVLLLLAQDSGDKESDSVFRPLTDEEVSRFQSLGALRKDGAKREADDGAPIPIRGPAGASASDVETRALAILRRAIPGGLNAAAERVAERWVTSLSPLETTLRIERNVHPR